MMPLARARRVSLSTEVSARQRPTARPTVLSMSSASTLKSFSFIVAAAAAAALICSSLPASSFCIAAWSAARDCAACAARDTSSAWCSDILVSEKKEPLTPSARSAASSYMRPMERSIWGPREVSASVPYSSSASVTNSSCCSASPEHHIARRRASTLARLCSRVVCRSLSAAARIAGSRPFSASRCCWTMASSPTRCSNMLSPNIILKTTPGSTICFSSPARPFRSYFLRLVVSESTW
mmetsp:Transcript_6674/g.15712  ORF Transcript_6674/g.15712 Transcript_6674/m.15712 type:complete len:239 (+) Transcript_6674:109-825(+)